MPEMSVHLDPALKACSLLERLLHYRGLELVSEPLRPDHVAAAALVKGHSPIDSIKSILDNVGTWPVVAKKKRRPEGQPDGSSAGAQLSYVMVLSEESKLVRKLKDWATALDHAPERAVEYAKSAGVAGAPQTVEVIFIVPEDIIAKKNHMQELSAVRQAHPSVKYQVHPFTTFSTTVPESEFVPKHEIVSKEQAMDYLKIMTARTGKAAVSDLTVIPANDPAIVWIGAHSGQFVRVHRPSSTAGAFVPVIHVVR